MSYSLVILGSIVSGYGFGSVELSSLPLIGQYFLGGRQVKDCRLPNFEVKESSEIRNQDNSLTSCLSGRLCVCVVNKFQCV